MTSQFWKGLLMAVISVIVTAFSVTPIQWAVNGIILLGSILIYVGKNAFLPSLKSVSPAGTLSLVNIISALLILLGNAIIDAVATIVVNGVIDWLLLGRVALAVTLTYLGTTVFGGPTSNVKFKLQLK
jgi:hypothetical protein